MLNGIKRIGAGLGRRVLVGMSGGVDSAVTAALLKDAGYEVIGLTLTLWQDENEDEKAWQDRSCCKVGLARHVAKELGIPHHKLDIQKTFQNEVIDDFCDTYLIGETPNPCVRCNARVKFARLLSAARELGADYLATGHYSRIRYDLRNKRYALLKGLDRNKDQSYFLYRLNQEQLAATLFPLGEMCKEAVYEKAAALGLPYEEILESQEVCFVTQKNYRVFLNENRPDAKQPGDVVTTSGELVGQHEGLAFYTVGQRRGLGIAMGARRYVTRLEPALNQVVLGAEDDLLQKSFITKNLVWGADGPLKTKRSAQVRIRHRAEPVLADLSPLENGTSEALEIQVHFHQPERGVTPGQAVVFYEGDEVIGGGTISKEKT